MSTEAIERWTPTDGFNYTPDQWREIVRYPGYRFTHDGKVWSCLGRGGKRSRFTDVWRRIEGTKNAYGYIVASLRKADGSMENQRGVHRLIVEAFLGPIPPDMEVRHYPNQCRTCNAIANLSIGTKAENSADRLENGTDMLGSKNGRAKLTEEVVSQIREARSRRIKLTDIAAMFGATVDTVKDIVYRRTWRHI